MDYKRFKGRVQNLPIILSRHVIRFAEDKQNIRNQLERWRARGLVVRLRRGAYLLNPDDRRINPSKTYIANQLYAPSYVSMEYALNYYGLIPERVSTVTSITTKKTFRVINALGTFTYQHVKPAAFRAFTAAKDEAGLNFFIAEPEKAVVDFLYLNLKEFRDDEHAAVFEKSYRLQNTDILKTGKVMEFAKVFGSGKLRRVAVSLCAFIRKEGGR